MKKIIFIMMLMALLLTACKREQKEQEESKENISNNLQSSVEDEDETETEEDDVVGDVSGDEIKDIVEIEETEEEIEYVEPEYEYAISENGGSEQVYIDNGEVKEPTMQTFSAIYTYKGNEYAVEFEWFVHEEQLLIDGEDTLPEGVYIQKIPGCTGKVLISYVERQDGHYGYQLCDLATNRIEPLLNGSFDDCASIQNIELLPDLSAVL